MNTLNRVKDVDAREFRPTLQNPRSKFLQIPSRWIPKARNTAGLSLLLRWTRWNDWWIVRRSWYRSGTNSRVVNGLTAPSNWSMTLCPRDVTECNAPVTWQRVLQATAVHRNSMRSLSLSSSFVPLSFAPPLSLSLFPLPPRFAPFSEVCFRAYESRNPGALAKNGHVIGPAKCQTSTNGRREGRRSPGLLQMTLIALRRMIAARADREGREIKLAIFSWIVSSSSRGRRLGRFDGLEEGNFYRSKDLPVNSVSTFQRFKYWVVMKVGWEVISDSRLLRIYTEGRLSWRLSIVKDGHLPADVSYLVTFSSFPFLWITEIGSYRADCREFDLSRKKRPTFFVSTSLFFERKEGSFHNLSSIKRSISSSSFQKEGERNFLFFPDRETAPLNSPSHDCRGSFIE